MSISSEKSIKINIDDTLNIPVIKHDIDVNTDALNVLNKASSFFEGRAPEYTRKVILLDGIKGEPGLTGSQGIQGETGPQGIQGETGPQGIQGVSGIGSGFQLIGHFDGFVGVTGTTNEIQFTGISISIPPNTFVIGDTFMIRSFFTVSGTAGAKTIQFRISTVETPNPATSGISCMSFSVANTVGAFSINRDNNKIFSATSMIALNPQALSDLASASGTVIYSGIDWSTQLYLYPTLKLVNTADRVTIQKIALFKY